MTDRKNVLCSHSEQYESLCRGNTSIPLELFGQYGAKRGLRDKNGTGVLVGLSNISEIVSSRMVDGVKQPCDGELYYRGYSIERLIGGALERKSFGFEETAYLLMMGELPDEEKLRQFRSDLMVSSKLPRNFVRDVVMKAPSRDIMNAMTKGMLTLGSYDRQVNDLSLDNVIRQCIRLIAVFPQLAVYSYQAYRHYNQGKSLFIHNPAPELSTAENILRMLRPDKKFTPLEAQVLDVALILHMEHGGGNNSTFTTRVVTSAGSDTYSVMAAALSSLKGPKHGGANIKVVEMMRDLKEKVRDTSDEDEIRAYLVKLLDKEAFDRSGLIYGMGHAVYSISDPRAQILKGFVGKLAKEKGQEKDYRLFTMIERLAPQVIAEKRNIYKGVSANVDFYSGFVYGMLDIPVELYTPLFAIARVAGWSAHRIEELINMDKIIRPAYQSIAPRREYEPIERR